MDEWPKALVPAKGPMRQDKLAGAAEGMGAWGEQMQSLANSGVMQPDVMTALTLFILGNQPKDPAKKQKIPGAGGGVAGGVWVRERYTIHRPLQQDEVFTISGESIGRHVHKGRRYGTNASTTLNAAGQLAGSNLTTGLLAYKIEEGLADSLEGQSPDEIKAAGPDWRVAVNNPCLAKLNTLNVGDTFGGYDVVLGLDLMAARDTKNPDNPIHSDPKLAKEAGLAKPIAGGAHVLAFPLEVVMAAAGREALLHGAAFDIRWKAPVYADLTITPNARVVKAEADCLVFEIDAVISGGATAMVGTVTIPLPREAA
jgi:acyl dehydratase